MLHLKYIWLIDNSEPRFIALLANNGIIHTVTHVNCFFKPSRYESFLQALCQSLTFILKEQYKKVAKKHRGICIQ